LEGAVAKAATGARGYQNGARESAGREKGRVWLSDCAAAASSSCTEARNRRDWLTGLVGYGASARLVARRVRTKKSKHHLVALQIDSKSGPQNTMKFFEVKCIILFVNIFQIYHSCIKCTW